MADKRRTRVEYGCGCRRTERVPAQFEDRHRTAASLIPCRRHGQERSKARRLS